MKPNYAALSLRWMICVLACGTHMVKAQRNTARTEAVALSTHNAAPVELLSALEMAAWSLPQEMQISASGTISQATFGTEMKVSPQTINPVSAKPSKPSLAPPITLQIKVIVPDFARNARLNFDSITLNGQPISLSSKFENDPKLGQRWVHLFFDRAEVVNILGAGAGQRVLTLQMIIGGGHLMIASDTVKLLEH